MDQSYTELKTITDRVYQSKRQGREMEWVGDVISLLSKYNIRLRQKDGALHQVTISYPTSVDSAIVVGLRYVKNDKSKTEDLFLFQQNKLIVMGYKGRLERKLHEYVGSHKLDR